MSEIERAKQGQIGAASSAERKAPSAGGFSGAHLPRHNPRRGAAERPQCKLGASSPGDDLEHEADPAADAMVSGAPAAVSGGSGLSRELMRKAGGMVFPPDTIKGSAKEKGMVFGADPLDPKKE